MNVLSNLKIEILKDAYISYKFHFRCDVFMLKHLPCHQSCKMQHVVKFGSQRHGKIIFFELIMVMMN